MRGDEKDLFEMVMENTRVGFGVAQTLKDSEGRVSDLQFLECNPPFEAIVGHAGETLRGKLWSALRKQSPNKDFDWLEAFQKCPQNDSSCSFSFFSSTLGRVVWVECRLSRPDTWVCSCVPHPNEKERSVLEKRLLDNRHRWEFALEGSDLGVWEENLETGEAFYSDKWKEMLGYGPDEIVPNMQSWRDRVHPDDRENVQREIDRHLSGQMSISSHEHRLRCKDGSYKWILSRGKIIERSADGTPLRAIGTHADIDARKRAENEAKKQSALITSLLDSIPDIIFFKDLEGVYLGCNSEFARHVGKRKEEIIGSTDYDLYPQAEADAFRENDQIMLMLGTTRHNEEWIRYPDGREVLLDTLKTPYRDENGKLVGVLGISRDITQSKKIQEEFEIVFEGTQDELFLVQVCPDGTFRYIRNNPANARETGVTTRTMRGKTPEEVMGDELGKSFSENYRRCIQAGKPISYEETLTLPNGISTFRTTLTPVFHNGHITKIVGSSHNITDVKMALNAVREKEKDLRTILETTQEGYWMVDTTGKIIDVNEAYCRMTGFSREEILRMSIPDQDPFEDPEETRQRIERLLQNKHETFEARHRCKNGSTLELEIAVSVVDSTPPKFVCFSRDISERKRMQAQLLEAKEQAEIASLAKSRFLSNMSHELRTPLNGIAGFSRLLLKTNLDDTQKEYLGYVLSASDVLKDVVGNILDFSKIEAGKMELYEEPVSLQELCSKSLQIFKLQAQQKEILLEMDYEESLPGKILADPVRLQQVLLNLVGNAVKFTAQGEVRLGVSWSQPDDGQNPRSIHFEVKDTGIGISEEAKNKIFNVFEQADNSTTRQFGGSGLGLTIARSLLELMRATLHLESEPGIGSRFFFDLPLKEDPWTES